jgi:hypothetical protein
LIRIILANIGEREDFLEKYYEFVNIPEIIIFKPNNAEVDSPNPDRLKATNNTIVSK